MRKHRIWAVGAFAVVALGAGLTPAAVSSFTSSDNNKSFEGSLKQDGTETTAVAVSCAAGASLGTATDLTVSVAQTNDGNPVTPTGNTGGNQSNALSIIRATLSGTYLVGTTLTAYSQSIDISSWDTEVSFTSAVPCIGTGFTLTFNPRKSNGNNAGSTADSITPITFGPAPSQNLG